MLTGPWKGIGMSQGQKRVVRREPVYDAVINGSGAAGGTAAGVRVKEGLRVAKRESGELRKDLVDFP